MKRLTHIFLIIQWLIFISYMTMDLYSRSMGFYSALLKYTGILLCCFYTWTLYTHSQIPLSPYWLAACVIVLFADYFLLFTPQSLAGVMTFCMVQCLYLCAQKGGKFLPGFILFSGLWGFPIYIQGPKTGCCIVICAVHDLYAHADHKHRHRHTQFCKISEY